MQRIIIFANGDLPDLEKARALIWEDDFILCADGGTRHAFALDLIPDLIVGDLDSMDEGDLRKLQAYDVSIESFSHDKNETDLELAIRRALELEPKQILVLGALGGRLDQTLANIALLTDARLSSHNIRLDDGVEELLFCRDRVQVEGRNGDIVSLLPWGAPVGGVQTHELKWALNDEMLYPEKTRGISNEMISNFASVEIRSGLLLVIHRRQSPIADYKS